MNGKHVPRPFSLSGEWPSLALLLAMFAAGAAAYPHLPEMVPAHWNLKGEVDNYFSRFGGAFALPLLAAGIYAAMLLLPFADPRRESYRLFAGAYRAVRTGLLLFLAALHALVLTAGLGGPADLVPRLVPLLTGALFVVIGNYLPQVRPNYFIGIRTPWTLANEEVWRRTHRFSGPVFVLAGLAIMAVSFLPPVASFAATMAALGAAVLSTIAYSFLIFRRR